MWSSLDNGICLVPSGGLLKGERHGDRVLFRMAEVKSLIHPILDDKADPGLRRFGPPNSGACRPDLRVGIREAGWGGS